MPFASFRSRSRSPLPPAAHEWTPEGTVVAQRYRALEGETVLVYTAGCQRGRPCATACLGCSYRAAWSNSIPMTQDQAAALANTHAATCRAMGRPVPQRLDDTAAEDIIRTALWSRRYYATVTQPYRVLHSDLNIIRVELQRTDEWIDEGMTRMVHSEPGFLAATPHHNGAGTQFTVLPFSQPPAPAIR